jgi:parvulin-like peptidyl-prolyl isomerase
MKRTLIGIALFAAAPLFAQKAAPPSPAPSDKEIVVARVNGETITRANLDQLWNHVGERARKQYEQSGGGKAGFLDNYIRKRLLIQKAIASGFDKRPDVKADLDAAKDSALFDLYVRNVVAVQVVTEADLHQFYDEHPSQFSYGERRYLRYLLISTKKHTLEQAREIMAPILADLLQQLAKARGANRPPEELGHLFSDYARKYSEDPTASAGGEIGWLEQSQLDPKVAEFVFSTSKGTMSGMLESDAGIQLMYVERTRPPEKETFEEARPTLREYLLASNTARIVGAVNEATAALRAAAKVEIFPANIH